jgi:TrmH family RNA methyltransferase
LKTKKYRDLQRRFLVDDLDLIVEAAKKGHLQFILTIDEEKVENLDLSCEKILVTPPIIAKLSDVQTDIGVIGVCNYLVPIVTPGKRIIAMDGVQDPGNGGTIVRSAHAFDFDEVLISETSFDIYHPKFIRATKGSIFFVPCQRVGLYEKIVSLKKQGYTVIATSVDNKATTLEEFSVSPPYILVVGSEGQGISPEILDLADFHLTIPMNPAIDSLNVGVASSICMYHLNRRG